MSKFRAYSDLEKMRSYSTMFSCFSFLDLVNRGDLSFIKNKVKKFDSSLQNKGISYLDYLKFAYKLLCEKYRCEYIYKNIISNQVIKERTRNKTVIFNEFKVASSVADIVTFNGHSVAYEIKTELDSDKRLSIQLNDYKQIFDETYLVTHESILSKYNSLDMDVGILVLSKERSKWKLEEIRKARRIENINVDILMRSLRTSEYKNITKKALGFLPSVNSFYMYEECQKLLKQVDAPLLKTLVLSEIKKRKKHSDMLHRCAKEILHICSGLDLSEERYVRLYNNLKVEI